MRSGDIFAGSAAIGAALVVYMHPTSTTSSAYQRRRTHHIKRRSASSIHHAPALAEAQGTPLTHFVTINFSEAGVAPENASEVFAKLRDDKFSPWVRRPPRNSGHAKTRPTFAWVLENGGNVIAAHWLVHLPEGRVTDFSARLPVWLGAVTGADAHAVAPVIHMRPAYRPRGARKYMLKGIEPGIARFYGIRPEDQGAVDGKRAGVSQSLGPSTKRRLREEGRYPTGRTPRR